MTEELQGQIEKITYTNEENGFTIAKVKVDNRRGLVTIVGNLTSPSPGEMLHMKGEWINHPKFGRQFKIISYNAEIPVSPQGIEKYLGSGLIKGIGSKMARRIVKQFGKDTLDVIENETIKLSEVEGIGEKRVQMIKDAWDEQRDVRDVMLFLQSHGVSSGFATKIFKQYGNGSIATVKENPYRLAEDIFRVGFLTADKIAENIGFAKDSRVRVEAGVLFVLNQLADEGNVYYPFGPLIDKCFEILLVKREIIENAIFSIAGENKIVIDDLAPGENEKGRNTKKAVYLVKYYICETGLAKYIKSLLISPKSIREIDTRKAISWIQQQLDFSLAQKQLEAVTSALEKKMLVITGGPGTGKTTIINAVLKIYLKLGVDVLLAAPTGRAAKRMSETTGYEARTIHRLLEFSVKNGGFQRNEERPLACDLLIIDEASMVDTILMYYLLKAVPPGATFILVGDVNQLPSVGAGNVLKDIIHSGRVPVAGLDQIFRQARESRIIVSAHEINRGVIPSFPNGQPNNDCYFITKEAPEEVLEIIIDLVKTRIPNKFGVDSLDDIQVLSPMHKGIVGAGNLNVELQKALNSGNIGMERGNRTYRENDKVMQIRNNYDKEVFNGDIGRISKINFEDQVVSVAFEGRTIDYEFSDLDEIVLAYAISIHKSQGSEYPVVIIPVLTQHYILLQRNLIYTGITRGRRLVVFVGTKKALAIAVKNDKTQQRYTHLNLRLRF